MERRAEESGDVADDILATLDQEQFEHACLEWLAVKHPDAHRRGLLSEADSGVDVEASNSDGGRVGLQCKTGSVGARDIQELIGSLRRYPWKLERLIVLCSKSEPTGGVQRAWRRARLATCGGEVTEREMWGPARVAQEFNSIKRVRATIVSPRARPFDVLLKDAQSKEAEKIRAFLRTASARDAAEKPVRSAARKLLLRLRCHPDRDVSCYGVIAAAYAILRFHGGRRDDLLWLSEYLRDLVAWGGGVGSPWGAAASFILGKYYSSLGSLTHDRVERMEYLIAAHGTWAGIDEPRKVRWALRFPGILSEGEGLDPDPETYDPETDTVWVPFRYRAAKGAAIAAELLAGRLVRRRCDAALDWLEWAASDCEKSGRRGSENKQLALNIELVRLASSTAEARLRPRIRVATLKQHEYLEHAIAVAFGTRSIGKHKFHEWTALCYAGMAALETSLERPGRLSEMRKHVEATLKANDGRTEAFRMDRIYDLAHRDEEGRLVADEYGEFDRLLRSFELPAKPTDLVIV